MKLKRLLIISPHFPPSNLAAVHRSRLFAQHLPEFGWEPVVLTVHEDFYEEQLDRNLEKLLPRNLRIEKSKAFRVTKPRIVGDVGLRGFFQLYKKAKAIIRQEKIDFVLIHIPSFYVALLGRLLHRATGVAYGIDYIDPWVHQFPGSERKFSRHWLSTQVAKWLEPVAVKNASLITGVAEGYYKGVQDRNPRLTVRSVFGAMPYGGERADHDNVKTLGLNPYLFQREQGIQQFVYAGAMLPKAYEPLEQLFRSIKNNLQLFAGTRFHFIGTGKSPDDAEGFNVKPLAEKYGLWRSVVFEYPKRIPYLDVLIHLDAADAVFILGSTEPHYTPSKVYQGVLSGKPVLAVLHCESTAVRVIDKSGAGKVLTFDGAAGVGSIEKEFPGKFLEFTSWMKSFNPEKIDRSSFDQYSARAITSQLASLLDKAMDNKNAEA